MPDHLDLLRRIAESPSGVIAPCTGIRAVHAPMEDVIASLRGG